MLMLSGGIGGFGLLMGFIVFPWIWDRAAVDEPHVYVCQQQVQDTDLAVTYRDAPLRPCGNGCRLFVHGICTPICTKHGTPMTRVK